MKKYGICAASLVALTLCACGPSTPTKQASANWCRAEMAKNVFPRECQKNSNVPINYYPGQGYLYGGHFFPSWHGAYSSWGGNNFRDPGQGYVNPPNGYNGGSTRASQAVVSEAYNNRTSTARTSSSSVSKSGFGDSGARAYSGGGRATG